MLILASASPRRKELLKKLRDEFCVVKPIIDERAIDPFLSPENLPKEESKLKAYSVFATHPNDEILACDTVVILGDKVLEKPKNRAEAISMLLLESGQRQIVLSGYTYLSGDREISRTVRTGVIFRSLTEREIEVYIDKFQPFDKAGAYGIQDDYPLIERIEGSFDNVMGLPTEDLAEHVFGHSPKRAL